MTEGDHLMFEYGETHYLEVVEVIPAGAACIIDTDVKVDFEAPVGYVEPVYKKPELPKPMAAESKEMPMTAEVKTTENITPTKTKWSSQKIYTPFGGSGNRLK